jgi:hypothetical protein
LVYSWLPQFILSRSLKLKTTDTNEEESLEAQVDEETQQAIEDWHYWVKQGYERVVDRAEGGKSELSNTFEKLVSPFFKRGQHIANSFARNTTRFSHPLEELLE